MTPQDIREKTFEKALVGGYDMATVDEFLEQCAKELTDSQKEINVIKAKMKVLVDKIEEYRANEDALNRALLSAQKLSVQIEAEARHKADVTVAEANTQVQTIIGGIASKKDNEEKKYEDAKNTTAAFIAEAKKLLQGQLDHLNALSGEFTEGVTSYVTEPVVVAAAPASVEYKQESIEEEVARIQTASDETETEESVPQSEVNDDTQMFSFDKKD